MLFDISQDCNDGGRGKSRRKAEGQNVKELEEKLKALWEQARERPPLDTNQFIQVEMGLFLLETIAPQLPDTKLWWIIDSMASLPNASDEDEETQRKNRILRRGRWKLWEWRNYHRWEEALSRYWEMPSDWRGYDRNEKRGTISRRTPVYASERYKVYESDLLKWDGVGKRNRTLARPTQLFYERQDRHEKEKTLWEFVDLGFLKDQDWWKEFESERQRAAEEEKKKGGKGRPSPPPPITVDLDDLVEEARRMDAVWKRNTPEGTRCERLAARNWEQRIRQIRLEVLAEHDDANGGFHPARRLHLEKTVHCAGVMGSGKSTLVQVLTYWLVRQGRPVTIILETVEQVLEWYDCFRRLEVPVVALLGKNRESHLAALSRAMEAEGSGFTGRFEFNHYGWEALSSVCLLEIMSKEKEGFLSLENYPCEKLHEWAEKNQSATETGRGDEMSASSGKGFLCPFYFLCPYQKMMQELPRSLLRLTTLSGLMKMWTPPAPTGRQIYLAEWLIDNSDLLVIDEADRIQVALDEQFSSFYSLAEVVDKLMAWLNRKTRMENEWVLEEHKNRLLYRQVSHLSMAWNDLRAFIYHDEKKEIINWLKEINRHGEGNNNGNSVHGGLYFTEWTLFGRLYREIIKFLETSLSGKKGGDDEDEEIARQKELLEQYFWKVVNQFVDNLPSKKGKEKIEHLEPAAGELLRLLQAMGEPVPESKPEDDIQRWWRTVFWPEAQAGCPLLPQLTIEQLERWAKRLHFTLLVASFQSILNLISYTTEFFDGEQEINISNGIPRKYLPAVPGPPMGNVIGFLMTKPDGKRGERSQAISVVQCFGIGRWLLYHFHEALTENPGAHVLLLSATGWAGASEKFHLSIFPRLLLRAPAESERKLGESQFCFRPVRVEQGGQTKAVLVSGRSGEKRFEVLSLVVKELVASGNDGTCPGLLENVLRQLREEDPERQRIILVTGSYSEAEFVAKELVATRPDWEGRVACVRKPDKPEGDPSQQAMVKLLDRKVYWLSRNLIPQFGKLPASVLVASLQSVERGHNIVDEHGKAVVGAVFFLVRPHPHPSDLSPAINCINRWAMEMLGNMPPPEMLTEQHLLDYREKGKKMWSRLVGRQLIYSQLPSEEREMVTWSSIISILQLVGRLVRGGKPARAYFIDAAFDRHAAFGDLLEDEVESRELLPAIQKALGMYLDPAAAPADSFSPGLLHLVEIIYGFFFKAVTEMIGKKT